MRPTACAIKRPETALLPALALQGTASMADQQASVDARVSAGGATNLGVKGKATIPQGTAPLVATVAVNGAMDHRAVLAGARPHACATSRARCVPT